MANIYEHNFGVQFGVFAAGDIKAYHSFRSWGLYPREKPTIEPPEPELYQVDVPSTDSVIDFSDALTGDLHYKPRHGTFPYVFVGDRNRWDYTYHTILRVLHGKKMSVVLDEDKTGYYTGRLSVGTPEYKDGRAYFTITGEFDPYMYDLVAAGEPWLWDPFSFETGVIRDPADYRMIDVDGEKTVTLYGSDMPVVPMVYVLPNSSLTMTYPANYGVGQTAMRTVQLAVGANLNAFPDFILRNGEYKVTFRGTGKVATIDYKTGRL